MIGELRLRISCYEHCYMAKGELLERSYEQHKGIIQALKEKNEEEAKRALAENWLYATQFLIAELAQEELRAR